MPIPRGKRMEEGQPLVPSEGTHSSFHCSLGPVRALLRTQTLRESFWERAKIAGFVCRFRIIIGG